MCAPQTCHLPDQEGRYCRDAHAPTARNAPQADRLGSATGSHQFYRNATDPDRDDSSCWDAARKHCTPANNPSAADGYGSRSADFNTT
jgi:hypothetical protein